MRNNYLGILILALSGAVGAEEAAQSGTSPSVAVHLDFSITVPKFLFFQVGSPGATIDHIQFAPTPDNAGNGTAIPGTGGNARLGAATSARVRSNAGQVTLTESNNSGGAGLGDGSGRFIGYAQLRLNSDDSNLPAPVLSDAGGNTAQLTLNTGELTDRSATWDALYLNAEVHEPGLYGTSDHGGRVSFTAATP